MDLILVKTEETADETVLVTNVSARATLRAKTVKLVGLDLKY